MPRSIFLILTSMVTIIGLIVVAWGARRILQIAPFKFRLSAGILIVIYIAVIIIRPSSWLVINIAVLFGAAGGAVLIGTSLGSSGSVVAFLVTAAIVDILSISSGFSRVVIDQYQEGTSDLLLYLTLVVPIGTRLIPVVGVSDLLVGSSAAMALIRNGLRPISVFGVLSIGFIAALIYGLWRGGAPGLPFIAITVLLLVWWNSINPPSQANNK